MFLRELENLRRQFPSLPKPILNGLEIQDQLGIEPGPRLGQALHDLQNEQIEGRISDRNAALVWLKKNIPK